MNQDKIDLLLLNEIKTQINRFDSKASILLTISGVLLGMSFGWIKLFKTDLNHSIRPIEYCLSIFTICYILLLVFSICLFIMTILPRKRPKKMKQTETNNSIWYYEDLSKMELEIIKVELSKIDKIDLTEQIKINSIIANKKYTFLIWGISFLFISILFILISIILYLLI